MGSLAAARGEASGQDGEVGILSLLPMELWEGVLDHLEDSKDMRSFCKAWEYPNWDTIMHRTKASWLFDEIFPLIFDHLSTKQEILSCRLVCKRWCKAVDLFLENNPVRRPPPPGANSYLRLGTLTKSLRDKGLLHMPLLPQKMTNIVGDAKTCYRPIRTPLITRAVRFDWSSDTTPLFPFLAVFGPHIWDFRIEIREDSPQKFFRTFRRCMHFLPNLKRVEIMGETTLVVETKVAENMKELESDGPSLPKLPFLETMEVIVFGQYRDTIVDLFLSAYAPQLRRLTVHSYKLKAESALNLENLTELTISLDSDEQLKDLPSLHLPLRRLAIYIVRNPNRGVYPDFSTVFTTINLSFAETLQALFIEFPVTYTPIQWSRQKALPLLTLPKLKTLELKEATFHSFNFLTRLNSLEYLHLYRYRWAHALGMAHHYEGNFLNQVPVFDEPQLEHELLDLKEILDRLLPHGQEHPVYGSNLWAALPKLKLFTLNKASNSTRNASGLQEQAFRRRLVHDEGVVM